MSYVIVRVGGKQYRVEKGDSIVVDRMRAGEGDKVDLEPLMYADGDKSLLDPGELGRIKVKAEDEAGFTLIETLVAIVILVFGLMAVSNLLLVAATSNSVANQSTAAATAASETLEMLKQTPFSQLQDGGDLNSDASAGAVDFFRQDRIAGVGPIRTRWVVTTVPTDPQVKFITVQSEGEGPMVRVRSRTTYTTFRSCTAVTQGCP